MNKTAKGVILTLIGGICWGFCGTCGEFLFKIKGFNSNFVSCLRLLSAGAVLFLISLFRRRGAAFKIFKNKKSAASLAAFGVFGLMISQYTYLTTISFSDSGTATILQYTGLAMMLVVVCLKELRLPRANEAFALALAMGGVFLVATNGNIKNMVISKECLFWGLFAGVGLAAYSLIPGKILKEYGSVTVSGFGMIIGGAVLSLIFKPWQYAVSIDFSAFLALCGVIIVGTVMAYNFYLMGVSLIGPVKAGMIAAIEPVAAAVFSAVWMKTSFSVTSILGFLMIISTVFVINLKIKGDET